MKRKINPILMDVICLIIGSCIYSVSTNMFVVPNLIIPGGVSGIAIVLNHFAAFPVGVSIILLNIPIFIVMWIKNGFKSLVKTAIGMLVSSIAVDIGSLFIPAFTDNIIIAALFGGAMSGFGLGLIFSRGITTGGSDSLAKLLERRIPWMSYGSIIILIDVAVVTFSAILLQDITRVFYAAIDVFAYGYVVDLILEGPDKGNIVYIVSDKYEEISAAVLTTISRGVTQIESVGAYTQAHKRMLFIAVRKYELFKVKAIVKKIDPGAFMIVGNVSEVMGNGFTRDFQNTSMTAVSSAEKKQAENKTE